MRILLISGRSGPGSGGTALRKIRRLGRQLGQAVSSARPAAVIVLYHRIFDAATDPWLLCTSPRHFAEHLDHLRQHYHVITLSELSASLAAGRVPRRSVVITLDDGYADNLWNAKPLLERYGVPGTFAVTTGHLGSDREFWWDELERLVLLAPLATDRLAVAINGQRHEWPLGEWARTQFVGPLAHSPWHVFLKGDPTPRHRAYRELYWLLRPLGRGEREDILGAHHSQTTSPPAVRPEYRPLKPDEVRQLAGGDLVEIAAHTVTHPMLSMQSADAQRWELEESRRSLEAIIGRPIDVLCYPYGRPSDVGDLAPRLAKDIGFKVACALEPRAVTREVDLLQLPRFPVGSSWDGDEFARRLRGFFRAREGRVERRRQ